MAKKQQTFEDRLAELEELIRKMEGGSLPLDETLKCYEAGTKLAKDLTAELSAAEKKMQELAGGELHPMEDAP